ncbi:MAG: PilZ domain-containing protein [Terriglobia bacterium]
MGESSNYYSEIGLRAAKKAARFPGLGQLSNGETFKGMAIIALFSFSGALLLLILWSSAPRVSPSMIALLAILPFVIWGISIYDAYRVAIEQRKRDAKRFNVQIMTTLRGHDLDNNSFEEMTITKNVSRMGACLVLSRAMHKDSPVSLEFDGREKVRGRVVWARETGNDQEHLVGMELMAPLKQFG